LQPLSTSMPNTCADSEGSKTTITNSKFQRSKAKPVEHTTKLHNVVLCFSSESYSKVLHSIVLESLSSVETTFACEGVAREIKRLRDTIARGSHTTLVSVFFLLLNVDAVLKDRIVAMDSDTNTRKMARFLMDLRNILAVRFFTDERCSPMIFVEECVDCYLLS